MNQLILVTLKGIFRDRVFQGIMMLAILFPFVPMVASFSMRQVVELSITLSLSLMSFLLLLLSVFLGSTSIWKDIDRRNAISVLSLPLSRTSYLLGRFLGIVLFVALVAAMLFVMSIAAVKVASIMYPPTRPVAWMYLFLAGLFTTLRSVLLVAVAILLSTVSTSFFLPIFGTITIFIAGEATQQVYDYVHSTDSLHALSTFTKKAATFFYYVLPNFCSFDYKINAIYNLVPSLNGVILTAIYFVVYTAIVLAASAMILEKREIN